MYDPSFQVELKDDFNGPSINSSLWHDVQGGTIAEPCSFIVDGASLFFNGAASVRQATTLDLDLRNSR